MSSSVVGISNGPWHPYGGAGSGTWQSYGGRPSQLPIMVGPVSGGASARSPLVKADAYILTGAGWGGDVGTALTADLTVLQGCAGAGSSHCPGLQPEEAGSVLWLPWQVHHLGLLCTSVRHISRQRVGSLGNAGAAAGPCTAVVRHQHAMEQVTTCSKEAHGPTHLLGLCQNWVGDVSWLQAR